MHDIQSLIEKGQQILDSMRERGSSEENLWRTAVRRLLEEKYDAEIAKQFENEGLEVWSMDDSAENLRIGKENMKKKLTFLQNLAEWDMPKIKTPEPERKHQPVINNINVQGDGMFGDHNIMNKIATGDFISSIEQEIEKSTATPQEKTELLNSFKKLTANPTFTTILSGVIGAFVKSQIE